MLSQVADDSLGYLYAAVTVSLCLLGFEHLQVYLVLNIEARGEGEIYMGVSDAPTVQEKVAVVSGTNVVTQRIMSPRSFSSGRLIKIRTTGTAEVQVRLVGSFPQQPQ